MSLSSSSQSPSRVLSLLPLIFSHIHWVFLFSSCFSSQSWSHRATLQAWNNKIELHVTEELLEKVFDAVFIKDRCTHLLKLVIKKFSGPYYTLVHKLALSLSYTPSLTHLELSEARLGQSDDDDDFEIGNIWIFRQIIWSGALPPCFLPSSPFPPSSRSFFLWHW